MELQTMPLRFRVWDKEDKNFLITSRIQDGYEVIHIQQDIPDVAALIAKFGKDRLIISQDTGLKDKNGESIYTGDIIKINGYYVFVNFDYGCTFFENQRKGIAKDGNSSSLYDEVGKHIDGKIVGNIWQNSNLLE